MPEPALAVSALVKEFGRGAKLRRALDGVSFEVPPGQICGVLGPNGAGKTTLVRVCSTMLRPESGSVTVGGFDVVGQTAEVRRSIGVVLGGDRGLYPRLTGIENLEYWGSLFRLRRPTASLRARELLELVGLGERGADRVSTYSRGMKQRLHLARGMVGEPQVLFLDEPTSGLDPIGIHSLHEIVLNLSARGVTILLTTHDMAEAEALCAQVLLIAGGKILLRGAPGELEIPSQVRVSVDVGGLSEARYQELAQSAGVLTFVLRAGGMARFGMDCKQNAAVLSSVAQAAGADRLGVAPASVEDAYLALFDVPAP
ncbi:MAG: ABC transporter ATP-binding protein [Actinomycetota bacterium]|nr:ABC transporter ATP-binding protein [Actinomycetota bacterium]MDQ2958106.1 ABC transporter ATP-binding protein [Actinomycetota bacterium]